MNKLKILGVYKWATMGGVERVLLNRAHAIKQHQLNIEYDVFFFFDSGGKDQFCQYLKANGLSDVMKVVAHIDPNRYDYVLSIDTPEVFDYVDSSKVFIECHTSYKANRGYLKKIDSNVKGILVPSEQFLKNVEDELEGKLRQKLQVMPNNVFIAESKKPYNKIYNKTPILYVGRLDKLKNVEELIQIVSSYNQLSDELLLMLAGPIIEHDIDLKRKLQDHKLLNRTIYLPPVNFDKVNELLYFVKANQGIFMSASISESYGLSVAEAMKIGLPVLAYDNDAHRHLLKSDSLFLYKNGIQEAHEKIQYIQQNYETCSEKMKIYSGELEQGFVEQWLSLFS